MENEKALMALLSRLEKLNRIIIIKDFVGFLSWNTSLGGILVPHVGHHCAFCTAMKQNERAGLCLLRHVQQGASMALPAKTRAVYPGLPVWAERVFRAAPVRRYMHRVIIGGHVLPGYAGIGRENRSSGPKMGHACGGADRLQTAVGLRRRPNRG